MGTSGTNGNMGEILSPLQIDAIGEVMNISMGSAATAVSNMLDKQVEITTPTVAVHKMGDVKYDNYEPALLVKIVYTVGITGANVMVFRQNDIQIILNTLMGIDEPPRDDFEFDELSISAACEVMNQMMGSSATALADFLGKTIDISPPSATVMKDENTFAESMELAPDTDVAVVTFRLVIKDMVESEFINVMTIDLAKEIIGQVMPGDEIPTTPAEPAPVAAAPPAPAPAADAPPPPAPAAAAPPPPPPPPAPAAPMPVAPPAAPVVAAPQAYAPPPQQAYAPPAPAYQQPYYPPQPPVDVHRVEFPDFPQGGYADTVPVMGNNMDLIMNVPLDVSIEIGTTRRKIKDIMGFTSGTVVELDKQAGAPVDIVVNGQLIAHGDVVVIDDNFGVRITEIVGTKELLNTLSEQG